MAMQCKVFSVVVCGVLAQTTPSQMPLLANSPACRGSFLVLLLKIKNKKERRDCPRKIERIEEEEEDEDG